MPIDDLPTIVRAGRDRTEEWSPPVGYWGLSANPAQILVGCSPGDGTGRGPRAAQLDTVRGGVPVHCPTVREHSERHLGRRGIPEQPVLARACGLLRTFGDQ